MKKALLFWGSALLIAAFLVTGCGDVKNPENPISSVDWDAHQTWWYPIGVPVQSAPGGHYLINRRKNRLEYWDLQTGVIVPLSLIHISKPIKPMISDIRISFLPAARRGGACRREFQIVQMSGTGGRRTGRRQDQDELQSSARRRRQPRLPLPAVPRRPGRR